MELPCLLDTQTLKGTQKKVEGIGLIAPTQTSSITARTPAWDNK